MKKNEVKAQQLDLFEMFFWSINRRQPFFSEVISKKVSSHKFHPLQLFYSSVIKLFIRNNKYIGLSNNGWRKLNSVEYLHLILSYYPNTFWIQVLVKFNNSIKIQVQHELFFNPGSIGGIQSFLPKPSFNYWMDFKQSDWCYDNFRNRQKKCIKCISTLFINVFF